MKKEEAAELVQRVISSQYAEVGKRILVRFISRQDFYMAIRWNLAWFTLYIDKAALKFSERAFTGCLAHELGHLAALRQFPFFRRIFALLKEDSVQTERDADLWAISHGFGEQLLQFHEEHNKVYKSYKPDEGLTKREVKKILKEKSHDSKGDL